MNQKYMLIIFDTNNLFYRNEAVFKNLTYTINGCPIQTGGIYGSLKSIMSIKDKFLIENGKMIFGFDNCNSKLFLRKQIDFNYKSNRLEKSSLFYKNLDYLEKIILHLYDNCKVVRLPFFEADDLLPTILNQQSKTNKILLVSNDQDWSRCLTENIHQLSNNEIVTIYSFKEKHGFMPNMNTLIFYKTFKGDTSDNIPNALPRFPKEILLQLLNNYHLEDIWQFFNDLDKGLLDSIVSVDNNWRIKLNEKSVRERLIMNYRLVNFLGCEKSELDEGTYECKYNPKILRLLYSSLGFNIERLDERLTKLNNNITNFNF